MSGVIKRLKLKGEPHVSLIIEFKTLYIRNIKIIQGFGQFMAALRKMYSENLARTGDKVITWHESLFFSINLNV